MYRMYLDGVVVRGPSRPNRWRIRVDRDVCSQSSMNSHRWVKPNVTEGEENPFERQIDWFYPLPWPLGCLPQWQWLYWRWLFCIHSHLLRATCSPGKTWALNVYAETSDTTICNGWWVCSWETRSCLFHAHLMASTTTVLNWSEISERNEEICFINRSTPASFPVWRIPQRFRTICRLELTLRRVVMANVAMDRFESVINVSRSTLHAVTAPGYSMAI